MAVGKINENYLKEGIAEFSKRIGKYSKLKILEISEEKAPAKLSEKEERIIKDKEGERILGSIPDNSYVVALHGQGRQYSSEGLAGLLEELRLDGKSSITFIIGGTLGLSETVLKKAHLSISFGKTTFPHQMMRLILLEQIFRSFKIINSEPYHR